MDFEELIYQSGLFKSECTSLFNVTNIQIIDWCGNGAPIYIQEKLQLMAGLHPDWPGLKFKAGQIVTEANQTVLVNQIKTYHWKEHLFQLQTAELRRIENEKKQSEFLIKYHCNQYRHQTCHQSDLGRCIYAFCSRLFAFLIEITRVLSLLGV